MPVTTCVYVSVCECDCGGGGFKQGGGDDLTEKVMSEYRAV